MEGQDGGGTEMREEHEFLYKDIHFVIRAKPEKKEAGSCVGCAFRSQERNDLCGAAPACLGLVWKLVSARTP